MRTVSTHAFVCLRDDWLYSNIQLLHLGSSRGQGPPGHGSVALQRTSLERWEVARVPMDSSQREDSSPTKISRSPQRDGLGCCMLYGHTAYSSIQQKMRVRMRVQEYSNTAAFPYSIQQKNCCMLLYGGHTADDSIQQIPMISEVTNPYYVGYRSRSVAETCFRAHTSI